MRSVIARGVGGVFYRGRDGPLLLLEFAASATAVSRTSSLVPSWEDAVELIDRYEPQGVLLQRAAWMSRAGAARAVGAGFYHSSSFEGMLEEFPGDSRGGGRYRDFGTRVFMMQGPIHDMCSYLPVCGCDFRSGVRQQYITCA